MKKNGEVTKFADYAKERIWRKNLDKFALSKSFSFPRAYTFANYRHKAAKRGAQEIQFRSKRGCA